MLQQELLLKLDIGETGNFKDEEVSIENGRFDILISTMIEDYKKQVSLPISDTIGKKGFSDQFFS